MNKLILGTLALSALMLNTHVNADEVTSPSENNWSVGAGLYSFSVINDDNSDADLDFNGFSVSAAYAFNNFLQVRGSYFVLEYDDLAEIDSKGADLMLLGGVGFSRKGFRGYGGAGFYTDEWSNSVNSEDFSGFQIGGGIGYNWGSVAVDLVINLREASKYEDVLDVSGTYIAASGGLSVSYLF